jgi:uncharacterized membrane protein YkvA (DUF1232 family)
MLEQFRTFVRDLKKETHALSLAARHPDTPWVAKLLVAVIVAYTVSPIDLIPDFVPVLGYLDDLILIPLFIVVAVRLIPPRVMAECRERAQESFSNRQHKSVSRVAALLIISIWIFLGALAIRWAFKALAPAHHSVS